MHLIIFKFILLRRRNIRTQQNCPKEKVITCSWCKENVSFWSSKTARCCISTTSMRGRDSMCSIRRRRRPISSSKVVSTSSTTTTPSEKISRCTSRQATTDSQSDRPWYCGWVSSNLMPISPTTLRRAAARLEVDLSFRLAWPRRQPAREPAVKSRPRHTTVVMPFTTGRGLLFIFDSLL